MVAEQLRRYPIPFVVLDTVMVAKSGDPLLTPDAVEAVRQWLLPQVALITPNLPEAAALLGCPPASDEQQMREQGRALLALGCQGVLMKGGHLTGEDSPDWLFTAEGSSVLWLNAWPPGILMVRGVHYRRHWQHCARDTAIGEKQWR